MVDKIIHKDEISTSHFTSRLPERSPAFDQTISKADIMNGTSYLKDLPFGGY